MNRDYFHRPVQSDRTSYGYGHTDLDNTPEPSWVSRYQTPLAMLVVFVAAIACVSL